MKHGLLILDISLETEEKRCCEVGSSYTCSWCRITCFIPLFLLVQGTPHPLRETARIEGRNDGSNLDFLAVWKILVDTIVSSCYMKLLIAVDARCYHG